MNEQIMANEEVMEVAETVAEEVVEASTKPKFDLGKALLGGAVAVGTVFGIVKLVKFIKAKKEGKKVEEVTHEPTMEEDEVDWDEVEKIAKEPIEDENLDA